MPTNLFGPKSKDDIRVGYISTDTGYVTGVTICEANSYAQQNPGTTFIFRNGNNNIKYLNINEVNKLTPDSLVSTANSCGGPQTVVECGIPTINFSGGGGVGALGNAVVGIDGAILAVDVIEGGFGYQYEPFVSAKDACQIGNGAVLTAVLGESSETLETYDNEADFEEYEICPDTTVGYGRNWGPNGEDLGPWEPRTYSGMSEDPIRKEIEEYQKAVTLGKNPFWTTRKNTPKRIRSLSQSFRKYDVTDEPFLEKQRKDGAKNPVAWNEFMNSYAVSPVPPSNVSGSDFAGRVFTFEWEDEFPRDGEYVFRGLCDNKATLYLDGLKLFDLGNFNEAVNPQRKTLRAGVHKIRVDLENYPIYETKVIQKKIVVEQQVVQQLPAVPPPELIGMLRYFTPDFSGPATATHFYTSNPNEEFIQQNGFVLEGLAFKLFKSSENVPGTVDVYRLFKGDIGDHFFTTDGAEKGSAVLGGYIYEGVVGKAYSEPGPDRVEVVRYFRPSTGEHFYVTTIEDSQREGWLTGLGYVKELTAFYAPTDPTPPVVIPTIQPVAKPTSNPVQNTNIFNTVDYIDKATRRLWRTNPTATASSSIIDRYGICPFDPTSAESQTESYAGTHTIIWNNINFPIDGDYRIQIAVDDNVTLYIGDTQIRKEGFFPGTSTGTGDLNEIYQFKAGNYTIRAELEQIPVGPLAKGNPMVLAVNIETSYTTQQVVSPKSWNDNPMGISITIDAPPPIVPKEIPPVQTGRCPPSPIWSTRFPGASQAWYPVRFNVPNTWSKFMNRYAISPVPPLDTPGSDRTEVNFLNDWNVEIPYAGYYGIKGTGDNRGRLLIDDIEVAQFDGFNVVNPKLKKVYLTKGNHKITTEIFNDSILATSIVNQKIFSTHDWEVTPVITQQEEQKAGCIFIREGDEYYLLAGGNDIIEVDFVFSWQDDEIYGYAATKIIIPTESNGPVVLSRPLEGTIGSDSATGTFKTGKKYGPIIFEGRSSRFKDTVIRNTGPLPEQRQQEIGLWDSNVDDDITNVSLIAVDARQLSPARVTQTLVPILEKNGVTYSGPQLASYSPNTISPAYFDGTGQEVMGKTFIMKWTNVDFPEDGQYIIKALADDEVIVRIDGVEAGRARVFQDIKTSFINITKGKRTVELELTNIPGNPQSTFRTNPVVTFVEITKNVNVTTKANIPWTTNPVGVSAILIPPPCPKLIRGRGVVDKVIIEDPGVGYIAPAPTDQGYPVILKLAEVIVENSGINYNCGVDQLKITPDNGAVLSYTCSPFGKITSVTVENGGSGFTFYPEITLPSDTGVNASFRPVFEVIRDPLDPALTGEGKKLIQVTDLVGLKQTGYIDGRAYYGAVFYENGVRYAGYYKTIGTPIRIYDTLQESITAKVTTPASAIERAGTDVTSNDPRLNIPGTPNTTT
jgi:hypothetical protein